MQEPERSSIEQLEPDVHVRVKKRSQVDRYAAVSRCVESRLVRVRRDEKSRAAAAEKVHEPRGPSAATAIACVECRAVCKAALCYSANGLFVRMRIGATVHRTILKIVQKLNVNHF